MNPMNPEERDELLRLTGQLYGEDWRSRVVAQSMDTAMARHATKKGKRPHAQRLMQTFLGVLTQNLQLDADIRSAEGKTEGHTK